MADVLPNVGEERSLRLLLNQPLYLGLFSNTPAAMTSLGRNVTWPNIQQAVGWAGGNEKLLEYSSWNIPSGASAGNPATYPVQEFEAGLGGASNVAGYYIRTADNILLAVGIHPEVLASGVLKSHLEGARYRVSLTYSISSTEV